MFVGIRREDVGVIAFFSGAASVGYFFLRKEEAKSHFLWLTGLIKNNLWGKGSDILFTQPSANK